MLFRPFNDSVATGSGHRRCRIAEGACHWQVVNHRPLQATAQWMSSALIFLSSGRRVQTWNYCDFPIFPCFGKYPNLISSRDGSRQLQSTLPWLVTTNLSLSLWRIWALAKCTLTQLSQILQLMPHILLLIKLCLTNLELIEVVST